MSDTVHIFRKSGADPFPGSFFFLGSQARHFVYVQIHGAVVHLIIHGTKLRLHAFQLVTDFGKTAFQGNDVFNGFRLLHQRKQPFLLLPEHFPVAFQIHILERDVFHRFLTGNHIGYLVHTGNKGIQLIGGNAKRQVCAAAADAVFVIGLKLFNISAQRGHLFLDVSYQLCVVFCFHGHIYVFNEFSAGSRFFIKLCAGFLRRRLFGIHFRGIIGIYAAGIISSCLAGGNVFRCV